jgi:uncharacterized Zn-finger protein
MKSAMKPFEMIETQHAEVACDGGGGALGHPRIYLHIDPAKGQISCPYCSRTYLLKSARKHG